MTNIECTPGSSALVLMVANPVTNATGPPGGVAPSMNSTVPPGMPVPGATAITVAVKVTAWPSSDDASAVVVAALFTVGPTVLLVRLAFVACIRGRVRHRTGNRWRKRQVSRLISILAGSLDVCGVGVATSTPASFEPALSFSSH